MADFEDLEHVTEIAEGQADEEAKKQSPDMSGDTSGRGDFIGELMRDAIDLIGDMVLGTAEAGETVLQGAVDIGGTFSGGRASRQRCCRTCSGSGGGRG